METQIKKRHVDLNMIEVSVSLELVIVRHEEAGCLSSAAIDFSGRRMSPVAFHLRA